MTPMLLELLARERVAQYRQRAEHDQLVREARRAHPNSAHAARIVNAAHAGRIVNAAQAGRSVDVAQASHIINTAQARHIVNAVQTAQTVKTTGAPRVLNQLLAKALRALATRLDPTLIVTSTRTDCVLIQPYDRM